MKKRIPWMGNTNNELKYFLRIVWSLLRVLFRNLWQWKPHIFESNRCWPHVTPVVSISLAPTRRGVIYRRLLEHDDPIEWTVDT